MAAALLCYGSGCDQELSMDPGELALRGEIGWDISPSGGPCRGCITDFRFDADGNLELCADLSVHRLDNMVSLSEGNKTSQWFDGYWSLWDRDGEQKICSSCQFSPVYQDNTHAVIRVVNSVDNLDTDSITAMTMLRGSFSAYPATPESYPSVIIKDKPGWACPSNSREQEPSAGRSNGGEPISPHDPIASATVNIMYDWPFGGIRTCSGVAISTTHVLTAAHCFRADTHPTDLRLSVGEVQPLLKPGDEYLHAKDLKIHPSWFVGAASRTNAPPRLDLAIVELDSLDVDMIPVAMLAPGGAATCTTEVHLYGYGVGALSPSGFDWGTLLKLSLDERQLLCSGPGNTYCVPTQAYLPLVSPDGNPDEHGLCHGDSGGPLVGLCDGQPVLRGVAAARVLTLPEDSEPSLENVAPMEPIGAAFAFDRHNVCGLPGVIGFAATRVDTSVARAWILAAIGPVAVQDFPHIPLDPVDPAPPAAF